MKMKLRALHPGKDLVWVEVATLADKEIPGHGISAPFSLFSH